MSTDALHAWLAERAARWPHGLSTTSTHDTKRSEDVRARLNVLSELPGAWKQAISPLGADRTAGAARSIDGQSYPSRNEEYLLYQTLVGTWPLGPMTPEDGDDYCARIVAYMQKAMREAKVFSNWLNPSQLHERAMTALRGTRARTGQHDVQGRLPAVSASGSHVTASTIRLAQLALKIGAPGVPDFYQGTELWDFSLVDPDNRRSVDFERRADAPGGTGRGVPRGRRRVIGGTTARRRCATTVASCSRRVASFVSGGRIWRSSSAARTIRSTSRAPAASICSPSGAATGDSVQWWRFHG